MFLVIYPLPKHQQNNCSFPHGFREAEGEVDPSTHICLTECKWCSDSRPECWQGREAADLLSSTSWSRRCFRPLLGHWQWGWVENWSLFYSWQKQAASLECCDQVVSVWSSGKVSLHCKPMSEKPNKAVWCKADYPLLFSRSVSLNG